MKGLTTSVYRDNYEYSCNQFFGVNDFTLIDLKQSGIITAKNGSAGFLHRRICMNQKLPIILPVRFADDGTMQILTGTMFGGTFAYSSDSRFHSFAPIPIHDRVEGGENWVNFKDWIAHPHNRQYLDESLKVKGNVFA